MFTTFPPRKEAEDWVLVPALFEGSQKNSGMTKSSVDNRHFSLILLLIFAKIYGVPTSKTDKNRSDFIGKRQFD